MVATRKQTLSAGERVADILEFLCLERERVARGHYSSELSAKTIPAIVPFTTEDVHVFDPFVDDDARINANCGPLPSVNCAMTMDMFDDGDAQQDAIPHFLESRIDTGTGKRAVVLHVQSMPLKAYRGRKLLSEHVVQFRCGTISETDYLFAQMLLNFDKRQCQWVHSGTSLSCVHMTETLDRRFRKGSTERYIEEQQERYFDPIVDCYIKGACGVHQWIQNVWRIEIGDREGYRLLIPANASGVRDLLRERDRPPGKARRESIVNWVNGYWRENRSDSSIEHEVISHLRGKDKWFTWMGHSCRVHVPSNLQQEAAELKQTKRRTWRRKTLSVVKRETVKVMKVELAEVLIDGEWAGYQVIVDGKVEHQTDSLDEAMAKLRSHLLKRAALVMKDGKDIPAPMLRQFARLGAEQVLTSTEA